MVGPNLTNGPKEPIFLFYLMFKAMFINVIILGLVFSLLWLLTELIESLTDLTELKKVNRQLLTELKKANVINQQN